MFLISFFSIIIVYVGFSLIFFAFSTDKYVENLQLLRKVYYGMFVAGLWYGILIEEFKINDWQTVLQLAALFVFIDLAVFQTPDILKIWNTEFQDNNYIRKIIRKNEEIIGYHFNKVQRFTDVVAMTEEHFNSRNVPINWRQYKDELRTYLQLYGDTFQFHVSIFEFETTLEEETLKSSITYAFERVEQCYNKKIEDTNWKKILIQQLLNGKSVELQNIKGEDGLEILGFSDDKVFIIVYYGKSYNMLIGLSSRFVEVDGIDAAQILNLAQIYDWYMVD